MTSAVKSEQLIVCNSIFHSYSYPTFFQPYECSTNMLIKSLSIQKYIAAQVSTEFMSLINVRCLQPTNSDLTFLKVNNSLAEIYFR